MQHPRRFFTFRPGSDVLRMVVAQAMAGVIAAVLAGVVAGFNALLSTLLGAAAYVIPNAVFALRLLLGLALSEKTQQPASAVTFFVGQFVKVALTVTVLMLAAWLGKSWLVWPALVWGLVCGLMGYTLLPLVSVCQRRWVQGSNKGLNNKG